MSVSRENKAADEAWSKSGRAASVAGNKKRGRKSKNLNERDEQFERLQQVAKIGFSEHDTVKGTIFWSNGFYSILGLDPAEIAPSPQAFLGRVHPDDKDRTAVELQRTSAEPSSTFECRIVRPDGQVRIVVGHEDVEFDADGNATRVFSTIMDVTEFIGTSDEQTENIQLFNVIFETAPDGISIKDNNLRYRRVNKTLLDSFGRPLEDILDKTADDLFPAESAMAINAEDREVLTTGETRTYEHIDKDGRARFSVKTVYRDTNGNPQGVISISRDITERKREVEALRQSERLLKEAQRIANLGFWEWDIINDKTTWSAELYSLFGIEPEHLLEKDSFIDFVHPDDKIRVKKQFADALYKGIPFNSILRVVKPSGEISYQQTQAEVIRDVNHHPVKMIGTVLDITDRKKAEEALLRSEQQIHSFFDAGLIGMMIVVPGRGIVHCNDKYCEITGYSYEEALGKRWSDILHPGDLETGRRELELMIAGEKDGYHGERRYIRKDGQTIYVTVSLKCIRKPDGTIDYAVGMVKDITEQKLAEEEILQNERRLQEAQRIASLGFWDWDLDKNKVLWSEELYRISGVDKEKFHPGQETFLDFIHPDDRDYVRKKFTVSLRSGVPISTEHQVIRPGGDLRYHYMRVESLQNDNGKTTRMFGTVMDITERKKAEEALRISEKLSRHYFEVSMIGMAISSPEMQWLQVNNTFCNIVGYSRDELANIRWVDLTHPDDLKESIDLYNKAVSGDLDRYNVEKRYVRKDGEIVHVLLSVECIRKTDGSIECFVIFMQDITEIKANEQFIKENEARSRKAQRIARMGFLEWNLVTKKIVWSEELHDLLQISQEEVDAYSGFEAMAKKIFHPDDLGRIRKAINASLQHDVPYEIEHRIVPADGEIMNVYAHGEVIRDSRGVPVKLFCIILDITEQKQAEEALRAGEERYRALYDDNPTMFFTVDKRGMILSVNQYGAEQMGYSVDQLMGRSILDIFYQDDSHDARANLQKCFANPSEVHAWELRNIRKNGTVLWARFKARVVKDSSGTATALLVSEDITEMRQLSEQLSYQASHDSLTSLVNRREFENRLQHIITRAREDRSEHALCYLDLDQFKVVNDTCGHIAGDELLRQLGSMLHRSIRKSDTLARLGGDEFAVLMEHCTLEQANRVAAKVHRDIEEFRFVWEDRSFNLGVSIGLVPINETSMDSTEVLKQADAACYAAKDTGRNRIHIYKVDDSDLARRTGEMQWVARINHALEENLFCLYAQPIVPLDPAVDKGEHYELLLRMLTDSRRVIQPGTFLSAAERFNLTPRLDRWIIDYFFKWLMTNPERLKSLSLCAINISALSLNDDQFLNFVVNNFDRMEIPPEKICFEITETAAIANLSRATIFIRTLKGLGCRFSLDDFGSGLSSFAYLKSLPVDFLKIDGVFVKDISNDPIDFAMVKSINDIGQVMGKKTIAEFAEDEAIYNKLKEIGVDYAQGYHLGRPRAIENNFKTGDNTD